jgi:hypothetical protein
VTGPDGGTETFSFGAGADGWLSADIPLNGPGIYRLSDGRRGRTVSIGDLTTPEFSAIVADDTIPQAMARASGGQVLWAEDGGIALKDMQQARRYGGPGWLGLRRGQASDLVATRLTPLCPPEYLLSAAFLLAFALWWRESRAPRRSQPVG